MTAVAIFGTSQVTSISRSANTEVGGLVFNPGANAFTFTGPVFPGSLSFFGTGIINNSGVVQTFVSNPQQSSIGFLNGATAGDLTVFVGPVYFYNTANAGSGSFTLLSGPSSQFFNDSSAGNSTFFLTGGTNLFSANLYFFGNATAGNATISMEGGSTSTSLGARLIFDETSSAGSATITACGATSTGANAHSAVSFFNDSSTGTATLIATGGTNGGDGGQIFLGVRSTGTPRVKVFGNGLLDISSHSRFGTSVGSIEGDGLIFLGKWLLTVGNTLDTTFSGQLLDGGLSGGTRGSLAKIGTGTLTLSDGASRYSGGTTISEGALLVANTTGSATGSGPIQVSAGTFGGSGIISGAVTVGTGSGAGGFLAPAFASNKQITLTLQSSLTLQADAIYTYTFKARTNQFRTDQVIANGVTISGAMISLKGKTQGTLTPGTALTVINDTSAIPISGTFSNLADGSIVTINGNNLQASYSGGDGNDLTLTVVP
jgi:fibronectin-binding autotransporter adhesin